MIDETSGASFAETTFLTFLCRAQLSLTKN